MVNRTVQACQAAFAEWLGVPAAFALWKGRVALYAIAHALGVGAGDEVILPGHTCVMNVNSIKYLGATPVYGDIEPLTYNVRPEEVEAKITSRTKAIIAQHTYGYPYDMDPILDLAGRHDIPVASSRMTGRSMC